MPDESPNEWVRGEWFPALVSTLITLPLAFLLSAGASFAPMACDNCDGTEAERFDESYGFAIVVFLAGLAVSSILMLASWCMPWRQKNVKRRRVAATMAPSVLLMAYVLFAGLLATPG
jgi:hypothetical protein